MLNVLHAVERELGALCRTDGWTSLFVDYHPPFVERVFRTWGEHRISLHCIHPCAASAALFHPHPWPSAMRVLDGRYEMAIGHGAGDVAPPIAARLVAGAPFEYEMTERDGWHSVRPIDGPAMSLMVTGAPWDRASPRSPHPLRPLPEERVREILAFFRERYPLSAGTPPIRGPRS